MSFLCQVHHFKLSVSDAEPQCRISKGNQSDEEVYFRYTDGVVLYCRTHFSGNLPPTMEWTVDGSGTSGSGCSAFNTSMSRSDRFWISHLTVSNDGGCHNISFAWTITFEGRSNSSIYPPMYNYTWTSPRIIFWERNHETGAGFISTLNLRLFLIRYTDIVFCLYGRFPQYFDSSKQYSQKTYNFYEIATMF